MISKKVLFVLTNTERLGDSGHHTGAYLSEITHPYDELCRAGFEIDMASPKGGKVPLDGVKMDDPLNATWMNDEDFLEKIEHTLLPANVSAQDYAAILFVGGHGAMFDLPECVPLQQITAQIFENEGVVASVCHGAAGLVNVRLSTGDYLLKGHEMSAFTNEEEEAVGMEKVVPFLLETKLQERGAQFSSAPKFTAHVVKSGRLVSGQNPASAAEVGQALVEVLDFISEGRTVPEKNWCEWGHP
ncbi:MAG: thiamine biosynthesis protein ThiJ [Bdellovibrio sp. ArHS]|uniref:type 1 glutamine amidotransferase domain-containing protein n=1 Tax=Bdellovibrio sp. ArHS TaxID=1569284 RepID=UPI0005827515|nr:type 1 glutamine amidotransferase domain-containing protein [Bdellovibrio sp. ArHS]KHD87872.1 MAG: thiamine biosynthesis protein ThiJ [Bdellovibrio sp. ArHS]